MSQVEEEEEGEEDGERNTKGEEEMEMRAFDQESICVHIYIYIIYNTKRQHFMDRTSSVRFPFFRFLKRETEPI